MLKRFFVVFGILLVVAIVLCWIYLPSFSRYHELKQEEEKLRKRIEDVDAQIKALTDEKYLLQNDVEYLEKVIREELGFVKPGEIIYELVTKKNPATLADKQLSAATPAEKSSSETQTEKKISKLGSTR